MNTTTIHRRNRLALLLALPLLLAGMLLAGPAGIALAQDESPFGEDVVTATTTANLRLRSAPSLESEILTVLPVGTVVGFTGLADESGNWVHVDAAGGPTGWVWATFLSNVPGSLTVWSAYEAPAEEEVAAADPPFGEDVVTATTNYNLRIRSAPSLDSETLGILPAGTVVGFTSLTDETGEWVHVDAAGGPTGWVWAAFLSNVPANLNVWNADATN